MLKQFEIDDIFKSCQDGSLDASSLSTVPHMTSLRNLDGESLLHVAIKHKHIPLIQELMKFNLIATSSDQRSALNTAAETGECEIVSMVIDRIDSDVCSAFHVALLTACRRGYSDVFHYLYSRASPDRGLLNSMLLEACKNAHADIAQELITAGADAHRAPWAQFIKDLCSAREVLPPGASYFLPGTKTDALTGVVAVLASNNVLCGQSGEWMWRLAGTSGSLSLAELYLSSETDASQRDACMQQLFEGACRCGHAHVVGPLLHIAPQLKFKPNMKKLLETAFGGGLCGNTINTGVIKELLHYDSAPDVVSGDLLIFAAIAGRVDIMKRLIDSGDCDINSQYRDQNVLSCSCDPSIIKMLLDAKADVTIFGCSVFRTACEQYQLESVQMLIDAGADINYLVVGGNKDMSSLMVHVMRSDCSDEQLDAKIALINLLVDSGAVDELTSDSVLDVCLKECSNENVGAIVSALGKRYPYMLERKDEVDATHILYLESSYSRSSITLLKYKALIDAGADVDAFRTMKYVVFDYYDRNIDDCTSSQRREVLRNLIDGGLDATACSEDGNTILMSLSGASRRWEDHMLRIFIGDILDCVIARQG